MKSIDKTNQEVRPCIQFLLFVTMIQTSLIAINILGQISAILYFIIPLENSILGYLLYPMAFVHLLFFFFSMSIVIYAYYKKRKSQLAFEGRIKFIKLHTYFVGYYLFSFLFLYFDAKALIN
jgi:hypothetical protein